MNVVDKLVDYSFFLASLEMSPGAGKIVVYLLEIIYDLTHRTRNMEV